MLQIHVNPNLVIIMTDAQLIKTNQVLYILAPNDSMVHCMRQVSKNILHHIQSLYSESLQFNDIYIFGHLSHSLSLVFVRCASSVYSFTFLLLVEFKILKFINSGPGVQAPKGCANVITQIKTRKTKYRPFVLTLCNLILS